MSTTRTLGSHDQHGTSLGFLPGGSSIGGSFQITPGSFQFGNRQFAFTSDLGVNFGNSFNFNSDILGQLPTGLDRTALPSLSQEELSSEAGGDVKWEDLVKTLLELGPRYIEAYRRGEVAAPSSAPQDAKSRDQSDREAALRRALARMKSNSSDDSSEDSLLSGVDTTTAVLGAGVAASLFLVVSNQS